MLFISQVQGGGVFPVTAAPGQYTMPWWLKQMYETPFGYDASKPLFVDGIAINGDGVLIGGEDTANQANVNGAFELLTHDADVLAALGALATETKAEAIRLLLSSLDGKSYATSTKQDDIITALGGLASQTKLEAVRVILASLDTKDFATNAKLEDVRVLLASIEGLDFATETTLSEIKALLPTVLAASGSLKVVDDNSADIKADLDSLVALITSLDGKDFASQTTLALVKTSIDSAVTKLTSLDGKDYATQTTLALMKTALDGVLTNTTSLDGKDFATAAKQDALKATTDLIYAALDGVEGLLTQIRDNGSTSGTATAARQDIGNASLSSIDTKVATQTTLAEANASLTALADDSWHFRNEVLSQHAEVKVAPKTVQLHLSGIYPISVLRDKTTLVSGGTVTKSGGEYLVTTAAGANSAAKIDSVHRGSYVCGLGSIAEVSIRVPTAPTGQQVGEWYYADASNGYGFGVDTTGIYVWHMKATTKTKVYQANWNADKLNGTGHSGNILSLTNGAVFFIDFTWFGYGIVEWGILAKSEDGRQHKIICHSHQTATSQSTDDVNLPIGVSVENGTATSSFTVAVGGRVFSIMGNYTVPHRSVGTNRLFSFTSSQFTDQYVLAVRKKSSGGFISIKALLNALNISGATRELLVKIVANPTIASPTWGAPVGVAAAETACEVATDGTYTAASGVVVYSQYTSGTGSIIVQGEEIDHIELTDVFSYAIVIQNQTTSNGTVKVSLNWQEGW
jgi:hypothetical protein